VYEEEKTGALVTEVTEVSAESEVEK